MGDAYAGGADARRGAAAGAEPLTCPAAVRRATARTSALFTPDLDTQRRKPASVRYRHDTHSYGKDVGDTQPGAVGRTRPTDAQGPGSECMVIPERGIPRAYGPVARRVVLPAVLALTLAGLLAVPAQADPTRVPDAGARPTPAGELRLPDGRPADPAPEDPATPPADDELGPLAAEISQLEMEVATAAERLKEVELEL